MAELHKAKIDDMFTSNGRIRRVDERRRQHTEILPDRVHACGKWSQLTTLVAEH